MDQWNEPFIAWEKGSSFPYISTGDGVDIYSVPVLKQPYLAWASLQDKAFARRLVQVALAQLCKSWQQFSYSLAVGEILLWSFEWDSENFCSFSGSVISTAVVFAGAEPWLAHWPRNKSLSCQIPGPSRCEGRTTYLCSVWGWVAARSPAMRGEGRAAPRTSATQSK